jgi:hypothetical protein
MKTQKIRATETGTLIGVRLQAPELAALDAWRKDQPDIPTRPEALRRLAATALKTGERFPIDDLTASNDE